MIAGFIVHEVHERTPGTWAVTGRCSSGPFCVGQRFVSASSSPEVWDGQTFHPVPVNRRVVALVVERIRAYGHTLEELHDGLTAELILRGTGGGWIRHGDELR